MSTLTPSAMLELPRPSAALMSPSGIRFAQSTSKYDFRTRLNVKQVYCASIATSGHNSETPTVLLQDVKYTELGWADDETLLFLRVHPESVPTAQDAKSSEASYLELWGIHVSSKKEYKLGHLPIDEAADVKIHHISPDSAVLAFSARVYGPDRSIYNAQKRAQEVHQAKQGSDVMVYDKLFIRHWDTFLDSSIKQVHVLFLNKEGQIPFGSVGLSLAD